MLIEIRNEIVKVGDNMPQWVTSPPEEYEHNDKKGKSNSSSNNGEGIFGRYEKSWEIDLSRFRVNDIRIFIEEYCK